MATARSELVRKVLAVYKARRREYATLTFVAVIVMVAVALGLHQRGIAATHTERVLDCQYVGNGAHTHDSSCYDAAGNLVCPLVERELHQQWYQSGLLVSSAHEFVPRDQIASETGLSVLEYGHRDQQSMRQSS